jgi:hypothetical protein
LLERQLVDSADDDERHFVVLKPEGAVNEGRAERIELRIAAIAE